MIKSRRDAGRRGSGWSGIPSPCTAILRRTRSRAAVAVWRRSVAQLPHPLGPPPGFRKSVQQFPHTPKGYRLRRTFVLRDRKAGIVHRLSLLHQHRRRILFFPDAPKQIIPRRAQRLRCTRPARPPGRRKLPQERYTSSRHTRGESPKKERSNQRCSGSSSSTPERRAANSLRQRQRRPLIPPGQAADDKQARQQLAAIGNIQIHSAHTVHNAPPSSSRIRFACRPMASSTSGAAAQFTQFVPALQMQADYALHLRLRNFNQPGPGQMLAQQHAEHGRLRRILRSSPVSCSRGWLAPALSSRCPRGSSITI